LIIFGGSGSVVLGVVAVTRLRDFVLDATRYRKLTRSRFNPNRSAISEQFVGFKGAYFRLKIVEWFELNAINYLDELGRYENEWPGGKRPQIKGDSASAKLAELDARWLKLD